jgi:hypothetical protein
MQSLLERVEYYPVGALDLLLTRGWAIETYRTSVPLFSQYSQKW